MDLENELSNNEKPKEKHPTGQVVGIIRKKWRQYCGIIQHSLVENVIIYYCTLYYNLLIESIINNLMCSVQTTRHLFVPAEKKIPKIKIETRQYDKLKNQRVIVAIDTWPRTSRYPLVCLEYLGSLLTLCE